VALIDMVQIPHKVRLDPQQNQKYQGHYIVIYRVDEAEKRIYLLDSSEKRKNQYQLTINEFSNAFYAPNID
jgi:mRNA-degrading endonuclease RelE of RelBE toxin-antitoxin system